MNVQHHAQHLKQVNERLANASRLCLVLNSLDIKPRSIVDIGCGYGFFLAEARRLWKIDRMLGIDGPWVERNHLQIAAEFFSIADLQSPAPLPNRFDLAVCLEVAEHIREASAQALVDMLVSGSDLVLFSAAIPGQGGKGHVNEQYPSYWVSRFAARGYMPVDVLHPLVWCDTSLFPWFRQNLLIFVSEAKLADLPQLAAYHGEATLLDRVHPHYFRRCMKQLLEARARIRELEGAGG